MPLSISILCCKEGSMILINKVEKQEEILQVLSDLASETQRQEKRLMRLQSDFESEYSPSNL